MAAIQGLQGNDTYALVQTPQCQVLLWTYAWPKAHETAGRRRGDCKEWLVPYSSLGNNLTGQCSMPQDLGEV